MIAYLLKNPPVIVAIVTGLILALICLAANWPRQQIRNQLAERQKASNGADPERYTGRSGRA